MDKVFFLLWICIIITIFVLFIYYMKKDNNKKEYPDRFISKYHCIKCHGVMSFHQVIHSQGLCKMCGYISNSTVCKVIQIAYEYIDGEYREVKK